MGKKIRFTYLTGSLLEPLFQFTTSMSISINPLSDPRGSKIGEHLHSHTNKIKQRYKSAGFASTLEYDLASSSSYIVLNFGTCEHIELMGGSRASC